MLVAWKYAAACFPLDVWSKNSTEFAYLIGFDHISDKFVLLCKVVHSLLLCFCKVNKH